MNYTVMEQFPLSRKKKMVAFCTVIYFEMMIMITKIMTMLMKLVDILSIRFPRKMSFVFYSSTEE